MTGEIVSHTLTLSNRVIGLSLPKGWVGKVSLSFRDIVSMPDWIPAAATSDSRRREERVDLDDISRVLISGGFLISGRGMQ